MEFSGIAWVQPAHFDALAAAIAETADLTQRARLREIASVLVQYTTQQVAERGLAVATAGREPPLMTGDLAAIRCLLSKGVAHNGLLPELGAHDVGRGLAVAAELLRRAEAGLTIEDLLTLEWVFGVAADADADVTQPDVRRLEARVRHALGFEAHMEMPIWTEGEIA